MVVVDSIDAVGTEREEGRCYADGSHARADQRSEHIL